jgi:LysM repeat protein
VLSGYVSLFPLQIQLSTMERRVSSPARILAALAIAVAAVAVAVAIAGNAGSAPESSARGRSGNGQHVSRRQRVSAAIYEVKAGDTLSSIAHKTGVPLATLLKLNPEVDPQILIAGEKLKLR